MGQIDDPAEQPSQPSTTNQSTHATRRERIASAVAPPQIFRDGWWFMTLV
jgi:hypothetical protein